MLLGLYMASHLALKLPLDGTRRKVIPAFNKTNAKNPGSWTLILGEHLSYNSPGHASVSMIYATNS